ncbi:class I SAM-dependent methyltransferase, partial [Limnofasciculus baicalensis]
IKGRGQEQDISFISQGELNKIDVGGIPVRWCSFEEIAENSITGCCFSNELVDAFPVHQFIIEGGNLKEIYVTFEGIGEWGKEDGIKFVEVTDIPSTPRLNEYFDLLGINLFSGAYLDGYRSEVNLAALDWLNTVASKLKRGFLLTIDYGYPAQRYYLPARNQGTLQCYYRHQHHNNPYIYIGEQDITAHVNFTALERQGELCGLRQVGFTKQGLFLMALGLGDRISALSANSGNRIAKGKDILNIMRRRDVLHQLIDPMGLGGFGVLVQSKGLTEEEEMREIQGLTVPPMV